MNDDDDDNDELSMVMIMMPTTTTVVMKLPTFPTFYQLENNNTSYLRHKDNSNFNALLV